MISKSSDGTVGMKYEKMGMVIIANPYKVSAKTHNVHGGAHSFHQFTNTFSHANGRTENVTNIVNADATETAAA